MKPLFDFTVNIPTLVMCAGPIIWLLRRWVIDREYPPHKHSGRYIQYPVGYEPRAAQKMENGS